MEEVIEGGAASADGRLKKGDKIIGVSFDASDNFVDVIEMKLTKVVEMIRGKKGTRVKLKVLVPKEENEEEADGHERRTKIYEMTRTEVKITEDEVKGKILESSEWIDGRKAKVGILRIPAFYRDFQGCLSGRELQKHRSRRESCVV